MTFRRHGNVHQRFWLVTFLFAAGLIATVRAEDAEAPEAPGEVSYSVKELAMVPMRDGVKLGTLYFLPKEGKGPWPAVVSRTPYNMERGGDKIGRDDFWLNNGYVRVIQDVRGHWTSEGEYHPFWDDQADGYDTVEWIAAQPWCTGKVGAVGYSATGITSLQAAMSGAPHLAAVAAGAGFTSYYQNCLYPGGIFRKFNDNWYKAQKAPFPVWPRPLLQVFDDRFRRVDISECASRVTAPILHHNGWYDLFSQGTINGYTTISQKGAEPARSHQKLMMGPSGHGGLKGKLVYPDGGSPPDKSLPWFDHWLKGVANGIEAEPKVDYYMMGDTFDRTAPGNQWRTTADWPPSSTETAFYCNSNHVLSAAVPTDPKASLSYKYDPKNPVPTLGGNNLFLPIGPMDQSPVSGRPDVLKFETPPLTAPIEIAGQVFGDLWVSTDAADTDFHVKLVDVYPDGYEALVLDNGFRLRYHAGFDKATPVEAGKAYRILVDLWSTAIAFNKGHKIAMHVSSSNGDRFDPHSNTWEPVNSYDQAVVATNTLYMDQEHPSRILLPVTKVHE